VRVLARTGTHRGPMRQLPMRQAPTVAAPTAGPRAGAMTTGTATRASRPHQPPRPAARQSLQPTRRLQPEVEHVNAAQAVASRIRK
jgi:hypothetical protein